MEGKLIQKLKLTSISIAFFLLGFVVIYSLEVKSENSYCPFGVCKGADPATLYPTKEFAELIMSTDDFSLGMIEGHYAENWKFIEFAKETNTKLGIVAENAAAYSEETGVCMSVLNVYLPNDGSFEYIAKKSLDMIAKETGFAPEFTVSEKHEGLDIYKWTGESIGNLVGVDAIELNYDKQSILIDQDIMQIFVWYDNFSECRRYQPEIPPMFN